MKKNPNFKLSYPQVLTAASAIGLIASFWQAAERVQMLKHPSDPLSCNLSPIVDCGGVLSNKAAAIFGPPNALIGIVVFSLLLAFGLQRLSGGQWTNLVQRTVMTLSAVMFLFSMWFFAVSVYSIGKICIFCIFIWFSSVPIVMLTIKDVAVHAKQLPKPLKVISDLVTDNTVTLIVYVYFVMITLFLLHFREYYF